MIHIKRNICLVAVSCTLLAGIPLQGVAQTGRTAKVQATQSNNSVGYGIGQDDK